LLFCLLAWLVGRHFGWTRIARFFLVVLLLYGGVILATPLPEIAVRALENRFPVPQVQVADIAGIIVLGGATGDGAIASARGQPILNGSVERLTTAIALHRALPELPLIVSGFSGRLRPRGWNEAEITKRFFEQQGLDLSLVHFEAQSRNTAENARNTVELIGESERPWLLITSAWHMPRAVGSFRAGSLPVLAYPVDYRTEPAGLVWPRDISSSLGMAGIALHEWLGLAAYYVTGRGSELFPAPQ
jgi:uncharacterized SAM-binding protein YcdF (DUF218 family)